jgi:CO dehydrogenase nickel-insertion accessory protein CooC1
MDNLQMDKLCFYVDADEARALKHILQVAESTVLGGLLHHLEKMSADAPEPQKKKFEVIRHYTCSAVYEVEAYDEDHAYKLACEGEGHRKTYDNPKDDNYEVLEILVEGAA